MSVTKRLRSRTEVRSGQRAAAVAYIPEGAKMSPASSRYLDGNFVCAAVGAFDMEKAVKEARRLIAEYFHEQAVETLTAPISTEWSGFTPEVLDQCGG
jgi:hypothetical protein